MPARKVAASRRAHILLIVVRDTGSRLVHAHDRGIDHLHRRVMTGCQRNHDLIPEQRTWPDLRLARPGSD